MPPGPNARRAQRRPRIGRPASFGAHYLPVVADAVQSGTVRTLANDDNTDFYTVPLTQETLRPAPSTPTRTATC